MHGTHAGNTLDITPWLRYNARSGRVVTAQTCSPTWSSSLRVPLKPNLEFLMSRKSKPRKTIPMQAPGIGVDFHNDPKPRFVKTAQVIVKLHPETGEIQAELPGSNGARHTVTIRSLDTIRTMLRHQQELFHAQAVLSIGLNADPTEAQIRHWEDHSKRGRRARLQSNCPFCIAEAKDPNRLISVRRFDTRGNPIRTVTDPSQLGF